MESAVNKVCGGVELVSDRRATTKRGTQKKRCLTCKIFRRLSVAEAAAGFLRFKIRHFFIQNVYLSIWQGYNVLEGPKFQYKPSKPNTFLVMGKKTT